MFVSRAFNVDEIDGRLEKHYLGMETMLTEGKFG